MLVYFFQLVERVKTSPAKRNKFILILSVISLLINIALWVFLYIQLRNIINANPLATDIPLHYNVFLGIDLYGRWEKVFIMPLIGLVVLLVNFIFALSVYSKKTLASYFLVIVAFFSQIILAAASLLIILINL